MGKFQDTNEDTNKLSNVSRRGFLKGAVAAGVAVSAYGCAKDDKEIIYVGGGSTDPIKDDEHYEANPTYRYGTSAHNCGGRCIIKAQVKDGKIVRFLTDETLSAYDGTLIDNQHRNTTQARACARCRGYKGRLYHPGRLKYPLKQTKKRGDITGFKRISWAQALQEITERLTAVQSKYGATAFHSLYACGNIASSFQGGGYTGIFEVNDFGTISPALRLLGGATGYTSDYSFHQGSYMGGYGTAYSGMINMAPTPTQLALSNTDFVMWGSNIPTTHNPKAYSWVKSIEEMKKRGGKVTFIGPELSEVGISQADEWIQIKPYTDTALILGMIYHMIDITLDDKKKLDPKTPGLDFDYIDTMVYGFFDSPAYWVKIPKTDGKDTAGDSEITLTKPDSELANYRYVQEVPDGRSLSAYIMGSDNRLTTKAYGSSNYMASQFNSHSSGITRNKSTANYTPVAGGNFDASKYKYKKEINSPKTPAWASAITGVSEQRIKELAEFYLTKGEKKEPVYNEWAGGQLKQNDGCVTLYALQTLLILTKNWGISGTGIANNAVGVEKTTDPNEITAAALRPTSWGDQSQIGKMAFHPKPSVTQWHNAIKFAFGNELKANGYKPNIPDWTNASGKGKPKYQGKTGEVYFDDGGVKALVSRTFIKPTSDDVLNTDKTYKKQHTVKLPDGTPQSVQHTYYQYDGYQNGDGNDNVKYAGFRFIINSAGNIPINQHANPIDSARMYEALPTYGYEGGKNNVDIADAFYLVTFDNFMSPSARYSDYVLPAKTTWEQEDFVAIENSGNLYVDSVIAGPGESKSSWDFAREWIKEYGKKTGSSNLAQKFTGLTENSSFKDVVKNYYETKVKTNASSPFHNKTWEQFIEKPISHAKPKESSGDIVINPTRSGYEAYAESKNTTKGYFPNITTADWSNASGVFGFGNDLYDTKGEGFAETESCPAQTGRFQVYSNTLVWRYENLFSKWHGYLPKEKQGQINKDEEGDPIVYPIPMYFDYEDHFRVAYGLESNDDLNGRYLLTTTHDRFRAHSSQSENPFLRELTHRTEKGKLYSGNDSGYYAVMSNQEVGEGSALDTIPNLNSLINADGLPADGRASYTDIWVNSEDFKDNPDGQLVKVENEIGVVYCTIRKTNRCVPGYVGLHQGCWYDPRTIDGKTVDVGGNCNTLMPSTPSRMDHGNGVQSAMVKITPVR